MSAYYNEFDPYAAEWLRNLIAAGHIAPGDVDERSIEDVRGEDLRGYAQVHLFAGIGGWSLALRMAGWGDDRPVWTGSCPCQPFSVAGRGRGTTDARHLWPHMFRLIRECRPDRVFGEQVAGAVGHGWLDGVCADLEGIDYAVGACVLGAHSVGAPHIRQRLWWCAERLAAPVRERGQGRLCDGGGPAGADGERAPEELAGGCGDRGLVYPERDGRGSDQQGRGQDRGAATGGAGAGGGLGHAERGAFDAKRIPGPGVHAAETREREASRPDGSSANAFRLGHAGNDGLAGRAGQRGDDGTQLATAERAGGHWGNTWLQCSDGTARRVEPAIPPLAHGLPRSVGDLRAGAPGLGDGAGSALKDARRFRKGALRGAGNAIVPQVAALFVQAYREAAT